MVSQNANQILLGPPSLVNTDESVASAYNTEWRFLNWSGQDEGRGLA